MPPYDPNAIDPQTGVPYRLGSSPINPGQGFNPNTIDPTTGQPYPRGNNPTYGSNDPWGNQQNQQNQNRPQQQVQRPGSPQNGMVGSPNLGVSSALLQLIGQNPAMQPYLQSLGLMPQVSSWAPVGQGGPSGGIHSSINQNTYNPGAALMPYGQNGTTPNPASPNYGASGQGGPSGNQRPSPLGPWAHGAGGAGGAGGPGGIGGGGTQREQSPFEQSLQGGVLGMLQNPTGFNPQQEAMLRNRASEPYAFQQQQSANDTRADAVRRGAASSDADIRDQLNRVSAEGARNQQRASFDVDTSLAGLRREGTLGALGAGNSLLGNQLSDVRSLREMMTLLASLQQQGGQQGLNFILGGGG